MNPVGVSASEKLREAEGASSPAKEISEASKPILSANLSMITEVVQEPRAEEASKVKSEPELVSEPEPEPEPSVESVEFRRSMALSCLDAVHMAMELLERMERDGRLDKLRDAATHVHSVVNLHDKLELYVESGAPGEMFMATPQDIHAVAVAADLLEGFAS